MKCFVTTLLLAAFSSVCWGVKVMPGIHIVTQSDGTELRVRGHGNADFHYYTTADGVLLFQEGFDFFIAKIGDDGLLQSTGILAHEANARTIEESIQIKKQNTNVFYLNSEKNRRKYMSKREPMASNNTLFPRFGSPKAVVILVEFSDSIFTISSPRETFYKYLNANELFDPITDKDMGSQYYLNYGSVKRYFTDMSFGKFAPQFDVYGPVKLSQPLKYYGKGDSNSENMSALFNDACTALDADIDFASYDSNGDDYVDLIYIIYAGYSQSIYGNSTDCIWPKSGTITLSKTFDGKKICRYGVNNELNFNPSTTAKYGPQINGIGLFCHEFSHCLGLPDLYPSSSSAAAKCINQNLDYWDIMDEGEYANLGYTPVEYSSWERERMDWMRIDTLTTAADISLKVLAEGGKAYRILNDKDEEQSEYYLVQCVQQSGWNSYLPGHGMLVYHIDYDASAFTLGAPKVNAVAGHPRMTIIPADGMFVPSYYKYEKISSSLTTVQALLDKYDGQLFTEEMYNAELAGDPFPGTSNVTELTDETIPAATVYRGGYMNKPITDIQENTVDGTVIFKFMGGIDNGISQLNVNEAPTHIYSTDGRYLGTDRKKLAKGLYIIGKKKTTI